MGQPTFPRRYRFENWWKGLLHCKIKINFPIIKSWFFGFQKSNSVDYHQLVDRCFDYFIIQKQHPKCEPPGEEDSIAHELNTPITTLKFSVAQSSDTESKTLLERQIKRLENIVSSIHTYDSDDVLINKKEVENYFSEIKKTFDRIHFKLNIDFTENKTLSKNDFQQMMNNLIDNSSKYGASQIDVSVKINQLIEIEVSDNGIGIPKEEKNHIFEKYYRITRDENLNVNGLGVGLFLVKKIVEKYKGNIEVHSKKKGVSFKINMPNEN